MGISLPKAAAQSRGLEHPYNTHPCINCVKPKFILPVPGELEFVPKRGKIHQGWQGDDAVIHGIDDVATIELEGWSAWDRFSKERTTNRPSASQPFETDGRDETMVTALVVVEHKYPMVQGVLPDQENFAC